MYEYDVQTVAGGEYRIYKKGTMTGIVEQETRRNGENAYDLQGRAVAPSAKGLIIEKHSQDGKNTYRKIIKH